ncbi:CHASE3 domain-containing protein [Glacieibacterium frigidum]|uniref:histidine kinase n=1 Tax=Glacieibacterium frigidum TaxID=2593303 RepID=A0A552UAH4_9SPHN|nr:CHASE3 domain-containing protein [Glacieibacterium frigidum]TRW15189.1 response regulator [Glacieibacterium frigidum]
MSSDTTGTDTRRRGLRQPLLWLLALGGTAGFGILLVTLLLAAQRADESRQHAEEWQLHTYRVMLTAERLQSSLFDAQRSMRGALITNDSAYLPVYSAAVGRVPGLTAQLRRMTRDNPRQQRRIDWLDALIKTQLDRMRTNEASVRSGEITPLIAAVRSGVGEVNISQIRTAIAAIVEEERQFLVTRAAVARAAGAEVREAARAVWVIGIALLALALVSGGAAVTALLRARRATALAEEAARARGTLETAVALRTAEIAASNAALKEEIAAKEVAESQVRQMQKLESLGQLTGGIAHDFNNMLAIVIGSLDLARRRLEDPTGKVLRYLDNAMDGAKRAATLTARLLAFSRQQALAPEPINPNTFVGNISELLRRTLGEAIQIETVLAGGLWRTYADAGELENAIVNLAVNARDAMGGTGKLTIETANTHLDDAYAASHADVEPGQYVVICVTDTGSGMPESVIAKAFDPFFTTKGVGKGTGLGLSQVYGFVKQTGGHVKIYSEADKGTTVKLYMPRWTGADGPDKIVMAAGELPRAAEGETVLVVEDEANVRLVTVDALRDLGYLVVHAGNADEALATIATEQRIDLLFTDIVMPGRNGRELAEAAQALRPGLPVLYTTGYTRNAVVHNGMLDAQVAFLSKPFSVEALAVKVRQVLDGGGVNRVVG